MSFRCVLCDRIFDSDESPQQHKRDSLSHTFDCIACDRHYGSETALQQHLRDSPVHAPSLRCYPVESWQRSLLAVIFQPRLNTARYMYQVPARSPHKYHISSSSDVYRNDADDSRPLKLVCLRKDDRCYVRKELKKVLERCLHGGKGSPTLLIHLLLYHALSAKIKTPQTHTAQYDGADEPARCEELIPSEAFTTGKKPGQSHSKSYHLPCQKPDTASHSADVLLYFRSDPGCGEFENGTNRAGGTHSIGRIANGKKEGDHLA